MIAGDVVLLRFPFSDLSGAKIRPAVVIAELDVDDLIACQITSQRKSDRHAVELKNGDFSNGGLRTASFARPGKLFTAERNIVLRRVGRLKNDVRDRIREAIVEIVRGK